MNNNSINFQTPRTRLGTICEISCGVIMLPAIILSFVVLDKNPQAGKAMIAQSLISAFSVGIILFFAYLPHTFNIPDDSPASVFLATIRMIRIIALMSAVLSLGITLCALFGYEPSVLLAVYVAVIVVATGWYLLKIKRKKST